MDSKTKKLTKKKLVINKNSDSFKKQQELKKNKKAVIVSTTGYCSEIAFWQCRHFPPKTKKLIMGILSYQEIDSLHRGQKEAGVIICPPLFQRVRQTFKKLPTQAPKSQEKKGVKRAWIKSPQNFN